MKLSNKILTAFATIVMATFSTAMAVPNGTITCKTGRGPDHVYKFTTTQLGDTGATVTHVETKRYLSKGEGENQSYELISGSGIANTFKYENGVEVVVLAGLTFEFVNGVLQNCKQ